MPVAASSHARFIEARGAWWLWGWVSGRLVAGTTSRTMELDALARELGSRIRMVLAEQTHGASLAIIGRSAQLAEPVAGCDGLLTDLAGVALVARTADCVPIFFADPARRVIGIAHAGWRGLAAGLAARMVGAFRHAYQCEARSLRVAIGPAIRSCCYEVGPEFVERFGGFVQQRRGRLTCDLIGVAIDQLRASGVRPSRIVDTQRCTACEPDRWFSLRREGPETGRLASLIMVRS